VHSLKGEPPSVIQGVFYEPCAMASSFPSRDWDVVADRGGVRGGASPFLRESGRLTTGDWPGSGVGDGDRTRGCLLTQLPPSMARCRWRRTVRLQ